MQEPEQRESAPPVTTGVDEPVPTVPLLPPPLRRAVSDLVEPDDTSIRRSQGLIVHRLSLMHALALQYLRRDNSTANLRSAHHKAATRAARGAHAAGGEKQDLYTSMLGPQDDLSRHECFLHTQSLPILGGIDAREIAALEANDDRVGFLFGMLLGQLKARRRQGGLAAEAPVYSRLFHVLSDGMLGFQQSKKVEDTPFPFPYAQLLALMLCVFALFFPLLAAAKVGDTSDALDEFADLRVAIALSHATAPALTFLTVLCYFGMHEVARTLEDPFCHPPNDLPAVQLQKDFNARLLSSWDGTSAALACDLVPERGMRDLLRERMERLQDASLTVTDEDAARYGMSPASDRAAARLKRPKSTPNRFFLRSAPSGCTIDDHHESIPNEHGAVRDADGTATSQEGKSILAKARSLPLELT
jgi:hypothetical protein